MKHRRLFGIALLFPYLFWGVSVLTANLFSSHNVSDIWNTLLVPILFYPVGAIFWFVPYTLLAIGLWLWSKNKTIASLRKLGLSAPIVFSGLMAIEYSIIMFADNSSTTDWAGTMGFLALLIFSSLVFGYLFVGITIMIFNTLRSNNLIADEVSSLETGSI